MLQQKYFLLNYLKNLRKILIPFHTFTLPIPAKIHSDWQYHNIYFILKALWGLFAKYQLKYGHLKSKPFFLLRCYLKRLEKWWFSIFLFFLSFSLDFWVYYNFFLIQNFNISKLQTFGFLLRSLRILKYKSINQKVWYILLF